MPAVIDLWVRQRNAHGYGPAPADVLELAPSGGHPYNDNLLEGPMRELVFGATGEGTVTYLL